MKPKDKMNTPNFNRGVGMITAYFFPVFSKFLAMNFSNNHNELRMRGWRH